MARGKNGGFVHNRSAKTMQTNIDRNIEFNFKRLSRILEEYPTKKWEFSCH
jgi:hypothetical protein